MSEVSDTDGAISLKVPLDELNSCLTRRWVGAIDTRQREELDKVPFTRSSCLVKKRERVGGDWAGIIDNNKIIIISKRLADKSMPSVLTTTPPAL